MDLEKSIRSLISESFEKNQDIENIFKKIRNKTATYEDADVFASELSKIVSKSLVLNSVELANQEADIIDYIMRNLLVGNYRLSSLVCEAIQSNLNEVTGLSLNPVRAKMKADRINGIVEGVKNAPDQTARDAILTRTLENYTLSVVDDYVRTNAYFQANAGLHPVIVRKWDGTKGTHDTKHTDLCAEMEGVFDYNNLPTFSQGGRTFSVFSRHEGCGCTVAYYPDKKTQGRITALSKGEKDTNKALYNTGSITSNSRNAVLRRRRQQYGKELARQILNEEWKGGMNGNAERHFS